ncbi:phosphatidylinositolglycan class [Ancylostoma caninum]|uniref:GPI ethanolamine phosphate transferase 1 n=1 Tax=Ancylostoma caninum TaxID=29170 RepID=A0A368FNS9_ANCCA|nr:phosphatidylinositolglycan class [Ancylostoma caninum]
MDTFSRNPDKSPFLHSLIRERKGLSGTSRTHVPTESRPGHVAIFAGFTEDVSAVARGWKHNPVPFDSVFNRSREAWMWGSPDIMKLFDNTPNAHSFMYDESDEDFASNEAYKLDEWVFDHVEAFFEEAKNNTELWQSLSAGRNIFFLHLLGLDTNGHGNKPHSKEYIENIAVVDRGIERMQFVFDDFFHDQSTAWIFTADHGMTDWGSHGAGSDEEVLTPFIAWGAGVQKGGARSTISQVDLTPLCAALLGVAVPVNSMGVLPLHVLDVSPKYLFRSAFSNFLQLKEQFMALRAEKAKRLWFSDFDHFGLRAIEALEAEIVKMARLRRFAAASSLFVENAGSIKKAIFHYYRYDRSFLGAAVSCCFVAWITLVWCYLTRDRSLSLFTRKTLTPNRVFLGLLVITLIFCLYCKLPLSNFLYLLLPVYLFSVVENVLNVTHEVQAFILSSVTNYATMSFSFLLKPFLGFVGTSVLLFIFVIVFIDRRFLAAIFVLLMFLPSLYESKLVDEWSRTWLMCCVLLLPFPFFPNVGRFEMHWLCILAPVLLAISLRYLARHPLFVQKRADLHMLSGMLFITAGLILVSSYMFQKPPALLRLISWCSLPLSLILPLFSPPTIVDRSIWHISSLFVPYSLLSIAYESIFTLCFLPLLFLFLRFEFSHLSDVEFLHLRADHSVDAVCASRSARVTGAELRRAVTCVCFVLASLFGTGNFASMNSFNPSTLGRFISVFSPFTMAAFLVAKLFIPLLMVSLLFSAVLRFNNEAIQRLSCLVLIITDLMAMCFFHQLKDDGSWLDIGLSISQYLISMCMSVAVLLLLLCASHLMTTSLSWHSIQNLRHGLSLKSEENECLL